MRGVTPLDRSGSGDPATNTDTLSQERPYAVLGDVHDAGIELSPQQHAGSPAMSADSRVDCLTSRCIVKCPVAYSSNARRTSGARSGSGI